MRTALHRTAAALSRRLAMLRDEAELKRIIVALNDAMAAAELRAIAFGDGPQFRGLVKRAREMHARLTEVLIHHPGLASDEIVAYSETVDRRIGVLEQLREAPPKLH